MAETATFVSGVSGRYATALFELAKESGALDQVVKDARALREAIETSPELADALKNPSLSREELGAAAGALAKRLGLGSLTTNLLGVMAAKRRLSHLPRTLADIEALAAEDRGETTVEITAAAALSQSQQQGLVDALQKATGRSVHMKVAVDPELIGGLIVKLGSRMIDASIRSKLAGLQQAMKEVG